MKLLVRALKGLLILLLALLLAVAALLAWLTINEYKPAPIETAELLGNGSATLGVGDELTLLTWNTGYCGLDENRDFFMDGGKEVMPVSAQEVNENLANLIAIIQQQNADVVFLQEVDTQSRRSFGVNQRQAYAQQMAGYQSCFALNYSCSFVPYPLPFIGKVNSGILTLSRFEATQAQRLQLPISFAYPVRLANLKRCLLVSRIPLLGTEKELVLVNLHLEAYDAGEGKIAQTAQLKQLLQSEREKGNYVVAGGDFNQVFSTISPDCYPVMGEGLWQPGQIDVEELGSQFTCLADPTVPSCRSLDAPLAGADREAWQYYLIDGFIVSDNLQVNQITTHDEQFRYTDHNPVSLSLTLLDA